MNRKTIKHQTTSIFIIAIFLFSFFYSCSKNETVAPDGNPLKGTNVKGASGKFTAAAASEHSISVEDAKAFIKSYYQETTSRMTEEEKKTVATSVYFPLDALENYINAMKQHNNRSSGLRVYFARYNKPHVNGLSLKDTTLRFDHNGVNTVIMVATETDNEGFPIDIIGDGAYQPFNLGISCPPMPPNYCKGLYCPLIGD
jgi:hypothetical protein